MDLAERLCRDHTEDDDARSGGDGEVAAEQGRAVMAALHSAMAKAEQVLRRHFSSRTLADLARAMVQGAKENGNLRFPPR